MFDLVVIRGKGKLKKALEKGKKQLEFNTKHLFSVFELPFSTTFTIVNLSLVLKEQMYIYELTIRKTIICLEQGYID